MSDDDRGFLSRFLSHPWTAISAGLGLTGQTLGLVDPVGFTTGVVSIVMGSAGQWFTLLGVMKGVGGLVGWIPEGLTTKVFVVGGLAYAVWLAAGLFDSWTEKFKQLLKGNKS